MKIKILVVLALAGILLISGCVSNTDSTNANQPADGSGKIGGSGSDAGSSGSSGGSGGFFGETKISDKHLKDRLYSKLLKLENTPRSHAKPLRVPLAGVWEIYFEKRWRILFEIDENKKVIIIVGFKHKDEMS